MDGCLIRADAAQEKAEAARKQILEAVPKAQIEVWSIDTSDNDSVRGFTDVRTSRRWTALTDGQKWAKQEPASKRRVDILICNAGGASALSPQGL